MKRGLLYPLLLIFVAFTACNKDKEDFAWKALPDEIPSENADLTVNGSAADGRVTLDVKSASAATLTIHDIIPGGESLAVDVEMTKQGDGYDFKGSQQVSAIIVRSEMPAPTNKYDVTLSGNVTREGKLKADMTIDLLPASLNGRLYGGAMLNLVYGGRELIGRRVALTTPDGKTSTLIMAGVIPGEPRTTLENVGLTADGMACTFSGNTTTSAGTEVAYTGSVAGQTLTLTIDTTLSAAAEGNLAGTWNLLNSLEYSDDLGSVDSAPFLLDWKSPYTKEGTGVYPSQQISLLGSGMVSHILVEVLKNVTFEKDGNITASYFKTDLFDKEMSEIIGFLMGDDYTTPADRVWNESPKNLAFWYTKDGVLYVIPDIEMIIKQTGVELGELGIGAILQGLQNMSGAEIKTLIGGILTQAGITFDITTIPDKTIKDIAGWLVTGIPLKYDATDAGLQIFVDTDMVSPFMNIIVGFLPALQALFDELIQQEGNEMMGMIPLILGIEKLTDLSQVWEQTTSFRLGLGFGE